jgi:deoxycytidine triphosphate deaminase
LRTERSRFANGLSGLAEAGFWQTSVFTERDEWGKRRVFTLEPNEFVLALTHESVKLSDRYIAMIEGRSTYARVGLSMHQTAPWIQPGWSGPIVLEIRNSGPLQIDLQPLVDRPCQLVFYQLSSPVPPDLVYGARPGDVYRDQKHPLKHPKRKARRKARARR